MTKPHQSGFRPAMFGNTKLADDRRITERHHSIRATAAVRLSLRHAESAAFDTRVRLRQTPTAIKMVSVDNVKDGK
ncbi:hypothetical protein JCM19992_19960 [Thermostilla marina]